MRKALGSSVEKIGRRGRVFWFLVAITSLSYAGAAAAGCGLDDSALTQFGTSDGSFLDAEPGNDAGDASQCMAKSCNDYPSICRSGLDNGCNGTLDCTNACPGGQKCIPDSGTCDGPPVCRDAGEPGGNCGTLINPGNGLEAGCGSCSNGYSCNGTNVCACSGTACPGSAVCCTGGGTGGATCNDSNSGCCTPKTCAGDYAGTCSSTNNDGCGNATGLNCSGNCGTGSCIGTTCCNNNVCNGVCCTSAQTECKGTVCCTPSTGCTANVCGTSVNDSCGHNPTSCGATCNNGDKCGGGTCNCGNATCASGKTCDTSANGGDGGCN